jgi:hypothetical protein
MDFEHSIRQLRKVIVKKDTSREKFISKGVELPGVKGLGIMGKGCVPEK